jgi:TonB family protein
MISRRTTVLIALAVSALALSFSQVSNADSWALPTKRKYYSLNKKFYFEVTPKKLESQLKYFEDKVEGRTDAGGVKALKDNRAKGAFYIQSAARGYSKKCEFPLVNEVCPVSALVSDKGDYVVTFDNWHSVGFGDDVVVIYRSNGTLIKKFGLEELLTDGDIETLPRSVSSMWWGGSHYIDEANHRLVLKVVSDGKHTSDAKFHELKIDLATGRPLEPRVDLFPQLRVLSSVSAGVAPELSDNSPSKPSCSSTEESFESPEVVRITSEQFYRKAKDRPLPLYPPLAKAARVESTVVVEMVVSKIGDVICARSLSGHPLLRAAAVAGALKWKFEPIAVSGDPVKAIGTVTIIFKLTERDMNPNNRRY